jgi:hypothetical protein
LLAARKTDPQFSAQVNAHQVREAKSWNEELYPLKLLVDHMRLSDSDTFRWTPDGAGDIELCSAGEGFRIQVTMAYPQWNIAPSEPAHAAWQETDGCPGGYLHSRRMKRIRNDGYSFGGGGDSVPRARDWREDVRAWHDGIRAAVTAKLDAKYAGCRLLVFARQCYFDTIDFGFSQVVKLSLEGLKPVPFEAIYILDEGESAFVEHWAEGGRLRRP